jgi:hypothetical protein
MIGAMPDRPTKISFGEMRDSSVRGLLVYCADYAAATTSRSAVIDGRMMFDCPVSSRISSARHAASAVPIFGRIFRRPGWGSDKHEPRFNARRMSLALK